MPKYKDKKILIISGPDSSSEVIDICQKYGDGNYITTATTDQGFDRIREMIKCNDVIIPVSKSVSISGFVQSLENAVATQIVDWYPPLTGTDQRIVDMIHAFIYEGVDTPDVSGLLMEQSTYAEIQAEATMQLMELMRARRFYVAKYFGGKHKEINLGTGLSLNILIILPLVFDQNDFEELCHNRPSSRQEYTVLRGRNEIGVAVYEPDFYIGPDPRHPNTLHIGATVRLRQKGDKHEQEEKKQVRPEENQRRPGEECLQV
ncbi:MAG: hypothetical protein K2N48_01170 [Muribaculaceae bacterium]|nr:hypothetical protein [Muribaculaceae bacterium]